MLFPPALFFPITYNNQLADATPGGVPDSPKLSVHRCYRMLFSCFHVLDVAGSALLADSGCPLSCGEPGQANPCPARDSSCSVHFLTCFCKAELSWVQCCPEEGKPWSQYVPERVSGERCVPIVTLCPRSQGPPAVTASASLALGKRGSPARSHLFCGTCGQRKTQVWDEMPNSVSVPQFFWKATRHGLNS